MFVRERELAELEQTALEVVILEVPNGMGPESLWDAELQAVVDLCQRAGVVYVLALGQGGAGGG